MNNENQEVNYLQVIFPESRIAGTFEHEGKEYLKIMADEGMHFVWPKEKVFGIKKFPGACFFRAQSDFDITLRKSVRNPDVPDNAPSEEKYSTEERNVSGKELSEILAAGMEQFLTIPFSENRVVSNFESKNDGKQYASILAPNGMKMVRPAEQIKKSIFFPDMCYCVLPRFIKDKETGEKREYEITMKKSQKLEGVPEDAPNEWKYEERTESKTAVEIQNMFGDALQKRDKEMIYFVVSKEDVSEPFTSKSGKDYVQIKAPGNTHFIRPAEQVHYKENQASFSLPQDYSITLQKSVRNENVPDDAPAEKKFTTLVQKVSATELKQRYEAAKEKEKTQEKQKAENVPVPAIETPAKKRKGR